MSLVFYEGSLLFVGGVLAMGPDCCCEGTVPVYPCPDYNSGDCDDCPATITVTLTGEAGKKSGRISGAYTLTRSGCAYFYDGPSASDTGYLVIIIDCATTVVAPIMTNRTYFISYESDPGYGQSYMGYIEYTDPNPCAISYGADLPPTYTPPDGTLALTVA